ncbi:MAG: CBS domain-containing protein [archaeon]
MKVKEIMSKNVVTITKGCLITEAAEIMRKKDISCLVVTCGDTVEGIVTERDVLRKIVANQKMFHQIQIKEIMSYPVVTTDGELSIHETLKIMEEKHIRRLVISKNNKLAGIVTESDFVKILRKLNI